MTQLFQLEDPAITVLIAQMIPKHTPVATCRRVTVLKGRSNLPV